MAEVSSRMLVRDVMNSPVVTSHPDERVDELARLMRDKEVGSVIILNGERPVGIVTDGDIVRKV
ncbi:MAG: CBS domain-containing protein, partial [Thaumarchaeota archaeon]|nr:CBS domain-containing protein [Nitrososphaerota archaeon]